MFTFIAILGVISTFTRYKSKMNLKENVVHETSDKLIEESTWCSNTFYSNFLNLYTIPLVQFIISWLYKIYTRLTFMNVVVFLLKYVSPTIYIYTFLKSLYMAPRERLKEKQMELEDIQLQIHIVHTKLCVRDAEFSERQKHLRHSAERLRRVRARVREIIDGDEALQRAFESFKLADMDSDLGHSSPKEERDFILSTFKKLKCDQVAIPEPLLGNMECSETPKKLDNDDATYPLFKENECRLKIIKVTNVYKVAYLKHYIKQKRLRRANRQMLLKKKMESVKQLLDEWQKALNMVINSKLSILNIERHLDGVSQEAMGDYTKPYEVSDSDSDLRNSSSDPCYDDYNLNWVQNPYRPYAYHEDIHENDVTQNYDYHEDMKYPSQYDEMCHRCANMVSIIEETNSQMAIEEIKNDEDCGDCVQSEK